jgi:hypothetical protein
MGSDCNVPASIGPSDPFDFWLQRRLREIADPVLDQEIPEDLLRLACDSRSEWTEMKAAWGNAEEVRNGSLD